MIRRAIDILASLVLLVIAAPLLALIALAVWLDSGAPLLFRQTRAGLGVRPFTLLKFRTMRVRPGDGPLAAEGHLAITRSGAFLRATKLDELPQLWNILRGEMSIIGPRPEVFDFVDRHREAFAKLLKVKPGLVDPASIAYFDEGAMLAASDDPAAAYEREILPRKLQLSSEYAAKRSAASDLVLIAAALRLCTRKLLAYGS
ncbi:MAG: sugar transferase [Bryobacteraceae bacterium]